MNVQNECIKIHSKYGMSEMANYKIQLLFDSEIEKVKKEYEDKLHWIPVEENKLKFFGEPFYILVKNKNNEPNLVFIEEHSDISDIFGGFTHWRILFL